MPQIKRVTVWDLDGVLIDSSHRYRTIETPQGPRIDLAYWREHQHLAGLDKLLPLAEQYRADLQNPDCFVIVATARELHDPDDCFIRDVLGSPDYLISRRHGDSVSGAVLKASGLARFFNLRQFKSAHWTMFEDNIHYLKHCCDRFNMRGVYVPSIQGH